jgi:hypothetical protein
MRTRLLVVPVVAAAVLSLNTIEGLGQAPARARDGAAAGRPVPRTPEGRPDMQGYWTNATYTPLERPAEFKDREFFTTEEAAALVKRRLDDLHDQEFDTHYEDAIWMTERQPRGLTSLRTSIVVEPKDGRIPPMNAEGRRRAAERAAARKGIDPFASAQTRGISERCIYWAHEGPPILPTGYNSNLQIYQSPGEFVLIPEMMPYARVVPLDGRARPGSAFRFNRGISRGRWEGDTMVVETTNFNEERNWRGASAELTVVERLTMTDADTIMYAFTVTDPKTWDVPWTGEVTVRRIAEPIYEYACHEGNYGIRNILSAQRAAEATGK